MILVKNESRTGLIESNTVRTALLSDEEFVNDDRMILRPSEVVQSKLMNALPKGMAIPVSCFHTRRETRR